MVMKLNTRHSMKIGQFAVLAAAVALSGGVMGDEFRDVGSAEDFDAKQNIFFDYKTKFGHNGWPSYWNYDDGGTGGAIFETPRGEACQWWVVPPSPSAGPAVSARVIKLHHHGRFRVRASGFPSDADLHLTLRYRDDLIAPAPAFSWNGSKWQQLGAVGGKSDHQWKTQQFQFKADSRAVDEGTFVF